MKMRVVFPRRGGRTEGLWEPGTLANFSAARPARLGVALYWWMKDSGGQVQLRAEDATGLVYVDLRERREEMPRLLAFLGYEVSGLPNFFLEHLTDWLDAGGGGESLAEMVSAGALCGVGFGLVLHWPMVGLVLGGLVGLVGWVALKVVVGP